jgi:hypothetical protein
MARRKCPPGVFCMENVTIMFICGIFVVIGLYMYMYKGNSMRHNPRNGQVIINTSPSFIPTVPKGRGDDVFFDIYQPPLRDDRFLTGGALDIRGSVPVSHVPVLQRPVFNAGVRDGRVPINVSTQGTDDSEFRQVGILTRLNGKDEMILPLMGRPLFSRRDKWNFYTLNDKNNMIKLPLRVNGQSGTSEYGCDNVTSGDKVYVEGYNDAFKVTSYDNNVMRYLPSYL